jgi:hypothetical protein
VNILFWDQWDFSDPLFHEASLWEMFRRQWSPQRMGLGLIFTKVLAQVSGWNTRTEAFAIGGIMCFAMIFATVLKTRVSTSLCWSDVAIPLMFLTPLQYGIFVDVISPSHGPLPMLLLMLYCLAWGLSNSVLRYAIVVALNFLLIHTSFGLFVGIITPPLLAIESFRNYRNRNRYNLGISILSMIISLLSLGSFFVRYTLILRNDFQFPHPEYLEYPKFIAVHITQFFSIRSISNCSYMVGYSVLLLMVYLAILHTIRILPNPSREATTNEIQLSRAVVILDTFTLIFCINLAIGRVGFGLHHAQHSRYVLYLIPGFFGIYLHLTSLSSRRIRNFLMIATVIVLIVSTFPLSKRDLRIMAMFRDGKSRWRDHYLETENIEETNRKAGFNIYPHAEGTHLKEKLEYLKARKLNLYLDYHP